jgi:hypothetical protein
LRGIIQNNQGMEQIAKHFRCDVSTAQRHKNEQLSKVKFHLFGDDVLNEMMGWLVE